MALTRFACDKYASVELNHVAFKKTGAIISQTPLGEAFTEAEPCENGMWLSADISAGALGAVAAKGPVGIVYTVEKEYAYNDVGLKNHKSIAGQYPRVGILVAGDVITSNCFQYDTTEFANVAALEEALNAAADTAVFVAGVVGNAVPKLTANAPTGVPYGKVVKYYTMPNGEKGIKYQMIEA